MNSCIGVLEYRVCCICVLVRHNRVLVGKHVKLTLKSNLNRLNVFSINEFDLFFKSTPNTLDFEIRLSILQRDILFENGFPWLLHGRIVTL